MRRRDRAPDPDAARELAAIDAALTGSPVGADEADLARLATLLVAERPAPAPEFRAALDDRVAARFAGATADALRARGDAAAEARADRSGVSAHGSRRRTGLLGRIPLLPAASATGLAALVAILVAVNVGGGGGGMTSDSAVSGGSVASEAPAGGAAAPAGGDDAAGGGAADQDAPAPTSETESAAPDKSSDPGSGATSAPPPTAQSTAPSAARKVERSSTVELGAPAERVDDVAQGVLGVVARNGGIVDSSAIATRVGGGEARFELRIPAERLQRALSQLSDLPDARVLSRTDDALDVNQAYVSVQRKLTAAEARRTATANALRRAADQDEIDRLSAELATLDRQIAGWERDQRALDRRVDFSRVELTVRTDEGASGDDGGAFTPGSALDDAGRLLAVTAGVAVIAAAALVPLALLAACAWPLARALRRRRREHALDAA